MTVAAPQTDSGTRLAVTIVMLALVGVIVWAIFRSKRIDKETEALVQEVASAGD